MFPDPTIISPCNQNTEPRAELVVRSGLFSGGGGGWGGVGGGGRNYQA